MKLLDIINIITEEEDTRFTTIKTSEDPETNSTTWDVRPTPLRAVVQSVEELSENLVKAVQEHPEDQKLIQYKLIVGKIKKILKIHISKTYGK